MSVVSNSEKSMNNKNKCCLRENYALVAWLLLLPLSNTATISQCRYVNKQKKNNNKLHLTLLFAYLPHHLQWTHFKTNKSGNNIPYIPWHK